MEGKSFAKLAKDLKLTDSKKLTSTDVDLVFAKIKDKNARRICFGEFLNGLELIA
jgi:ribonuclease HII